MTGLPADGNLRRQDSLRTWKLQDCPLTGDEGDWYRQRRQIENEHIMPNLYIISGCNGAGKTTASYTLLPEMLECRQFVNSDEFAKGLSPFSPERASILASRYMLMRIRYLLQRKEDFGIETTLATRTLLRTVQAAQEEGYFVTVLYFWLNSPDLAVKRVRARVAAGGHNIPEETVRRRYRVGLDYFFHDYAPVSDRWILADNSQVPFRVVAEGGKARPLNVRDKDTFESIRALAERSEGHDEDGQDRTDADRLETHRITDEE